jgi:flavin-dependent dehydrogenase
MQRSSAMPSPSDTFDAIVVGGGPAGSTCAHFLGRAGMRVAVIDRARFPRVKLCAGWLSPRIWDVLELSPRQYPGGLWPWRVCHVRRGDQERALPGRGWFIRRYELDDFLLRRSGATLELGAASEITRDERGWWALAGLRSRFLVGAGGTHCPVAKLIGPPRPRGPVGAQELELRADRGQIASARAGADGEPELLLFDDVGGYGWNVPKTDWINVGCGTIEPTSVRATWQRTRALLHDRGHLPPASEPALAHMKGHAYYLFDPAHLGAAARVDHDGRGGAFLVGDALGLAHPITAEGIVPAAISGRLLAEAIIAGAPASYPDRLAAEPLFADYRRLRTLLSRTTPRWLRWAAARRGLRGLHARAVVDGFAWMFSGAPLPAPRLIDFVLSRAEER